MLRQKARVDWIALGDGNTRFFHHAIQKRTFKNNISKLFFEGAWITDSKQITEAFYSYYSTFFECNHFEALGLGILELPTLTAMAKQQLVTKVAEQEIENALHDLEDLKAPGPDGMNVKSLKFLWPFIKEKISAFIDNFCRFYYMPSWVNSSFITLVQKGPNPTHLKVSLRVSRLVIIKSASRICNLQFVDDTIVFLDGSIDSVRGVKRMLKKQQHYSSANKVHGP
ncbi:uncharacterized protein LOC108216951 [Daucus carota subsp. sativus]|uniref:uncharacterized protein LOC108216951 n=1 Tax=Daucus carota subsp. sativus TaxID=79200 RepID=UPI0007EFA3A7|nr:PREDICTED: uncharacterized protein LOC108216951 [Daucus carota subsp. sativus]